MVRGTLRVHSVGQPGSGVVCGPSVFLWDPTPVGLKFSFLVILNRKLRYRPLEDLFLGLLGSSLPVTFSGVDLHRRDRSRNETRGPFSESKEETVCFGSKDGVLQRYPRFMFTKTLYQGSACSVRPTLSVPWTRRTTTPPAGLSRVS